MRNSFNDFNRRQDRFNRRHDLGMTLFGFLFGAVFLLVMLGFGASAYLGYKCYSSNDPKSMACYFVGDRSTVRIIGE
jgi:hypothetical protein